MSSSDRRRPATFEHRNWGEGFVVDQTVLELVRRAERVGRSRKGPHPINFSTLFFSLASGEVEHPACSWLSSFVSETKDLPLYAAFRDTDQGIASGDVGAFSIVTEPNSIEPQPISIDTQSASIETQPSPSCVHMLEQAADIARSTKTSPERRIDPWHLLASYAARTPTNHFANFDDWQINRRKLRESLRRELDGVWPATEDVSRFLDELAPQTTSRPPLFEIEGAQVTDGLQAILRAAAWIRRNSDSDRDSISTNALFFALAKGGYQELIPVESLVLQEALEVVNYDVEQSLGDYVKGETAPTTSALESVEIGNHMASENVRTIITQAMERARQDGRSVMDTRDVLVGLLRRLGDSHTRRGLAELNARQSALRRAVVDAARRLRTEGAGALESLLITPPPILAVPVANDTPSGDDRLDVLRFARALAGVVASEAVEPPISIGVFGDWGSGKSFFLRLVEEQIDELSASGSPFCQDVLKIRFNAWHYADTSLWASLVHTIFTTLDEHLRGQEAKRGEAEMNELWKRLRVAERAESESRANLQHAEDEFKEAEQTLSNIENEIESCIDALPRLTPREVLSSFRDEMYPSNQPAKELKALAAEAERHLGIRNLSTLVEGASGLNGDFDNLLGDARVQGARFRSLAERLPALIGWRTALGAASIVAVLVGLGWLVVRQFSIDSSVTALVEVITAAGVFTVWARTKLSNGNAVLDKLERIQQDLQRRSAAKLHDAEVTGTKARVKAEAARSRLEQARHLYEQKREQKRKLERELKASAPTRRLANFIRSRLSEGDYEQHLGIISSISRDFDTVAEFLAERREGKLDVEVLDTIGGHTADKAPLNPVDRIVLFIDDLDRCPAHLVVQVLEAIHLLMAKPLFVAVVGVDVRWVVSSLHHRFPDQLSEPEFLFGASRTLALTTDPPASKTEDPRPHKPVRASNSASALDYIEKIFQIPFWLPQMEDQGARNLISELTPDATRLVEGPASRQRGEDNGGSGARTGAGTSSGADSGSGAPMLSERQTAGALTVSGRERLLMLRLAGGIGRSPRRLKRFVNCFRVLKASVRVDELEQFSDAERIGPSPAACLTLLAISTGAPSLANDVIRAVRTSDAKSWDTLRQAIVSLLPPDVTGEREAIVRALNVVEQQLDQDALLDQVKNWSETVARFTFRSGRL